MLMGGVFADDNALSIFDGVCKGYLREAWQVRREFYQQGWGAGYTVYIMYIICQERTILYNVFF